MDSLLQKIKSNYSSILNNINQIKYDNSNNRNKINEMIRRQDLIKRQSKIMYNLGDWELRNALKKVYDNGYSISYVHKWSYDGYSVGTIGKSLNITFFRNFFDKNNPEEFSQCDLMKYAGCITEEGCIRSMIIHELGHVNFREYIDGKWISMLKDSHNQYWTNWVILRFIKFNSIVNSFRPDLLIGFLILNGFNSTYEKPSSNLSKLLGHHYKTILKKHGYISDRLIMPRINSPNDW
jgi:hypothetical protein